MVAKSYQDLEVVSDVFTASGKQYVNVKLKSGKIKSVRYYTEAEYRKMYPDATPAVSRSADPYYKPQKEVLGFTKGYITIFKGDVETHNDWFRASIARYTRWWGWYIISTDDVPFDLPAGITPIRLPWDLVGNDDGNLKSENQVKEAVESIIYDDSPSQYVGSIGQRLELHLTVEKLIDVGDKYPTSMHLMRDADGNCFVWTTTAKSWCVGSRHHIRGTVKEHKTFQGERQTWLTRCMEVK